MNKEKKNAFINNVLNLSFTVEVLRISHDIEKVWIHLIEPKKHVFVANLYHFEGLESRSR